MSAELVERLQDEKATLITRVVELEQALALERGLRLEAEARVAELQAREDEVFVEGVNIGSSARESGEAQANHRADAASRAWNEMNDLIAETSQKLVDLRAYATRLLAALTQQRQALEATVKWLEWGDGAEETVRGDCYFALNSTDHAALVAEGAALGVSQKAQEGPSEAAQGSGSAGS